MILKILGDGVQIPSKYTESDKRQGKCPVSKPTYRSTGKGRARRLDVRKKPVTMSSVGREAKAMLKSDLSEKTVRKLTGSSFNVLCR